jgi:hypothetical protein
MLKTHRYDLPPGIEKNRADWQKVVSATDYELTQARAKFKKEVSVLSDPHMVRFIPRLLRWFLGCRKCQTYKRK